MGLWSAHAVFVVLYGGVALWDGQGEPGAFGEPWAAGVAVASFVASVGIGRWIPDPTARLFARCQLAEIPGLLAVLGWRSGASVGALVVGLVLMSVALALCAPIRRSS